jgi:hypothetical protein
MPNPYHILVSMANKAFCRLPIGQKLAISNYIKEKEKYPENIQKRKTA